MLETVLQALVVFVGAALAQLLATQIALIPVRRLPADHHWSERARRGWALRSMISLNPAIVLGIMIGFQFTEVDSRLLIGVAAFAGALLGSLPAARTFYRRRVTLIHLLQDFAVFFLVLGPAVVVFCLMGVLLVPEPGITNTSIAIMAGGLVVAILLSLGGGMQLTRALGLIRPASERLTRLVHAAADSAQLPRPKVLSLRWHQANAFAFPFTGTVAFTTTAEETLTDPQITAVAAHELAHLAEPLSARLIRLSGVLALFPLFTIPVWRQVEPLWGILLPLLCFIAGTRLLRSFAQRMEVKADAMAHSHGQDEQALARALERIYQENLIPAVMRGAKNQTHPHLYDRMIDAGLEPEFPRPKAPGFALTFVCAVLFFFGAITLSTMGVRVIEDLPFAYAEVESEA